MEVTKHSFTNIAEHTFSSLTGYYQSRVMHVMGSGVESKYPDSKPWPVCQFRSPSVQYIYNWSVLYSVSPVLYCLKKTPRGQNVTKTRWSFVHSKIARIILSQISCLTYKWKAIKQNCCFSKLFWLLQLRDYPSCANSNNLVVVKYFVGGQYHTVKTKLLF